MLPSDKVIKEHAYLVSRGVRPLALIGTVSSDDETAVISAYDKVGEFAGKVGYGLGNQVIPVVSKRKGRHVVDVGFASRKWVAETLNWLYEAEIPEPYYSRIIGMLLGYSTDAIAVYDESQGSSFFPN